MAEEIQKFDPSKLMDGVKERIKATFVGLIPDDAWEQMVKREVDAFFEPCKSFFKIEVTSDHWNDNNKKFNFTYEGEMSPFRQIIWMMCINKTQEVLKEHITKEYIGDVWISKEEDIKEGMKQVVEASIPTAVTSFFRSIAFGQMNQLRDQIINNRI